MTNFTFSLISRRDGVPYEYASANFQCLKDARDAAINSLDDEKDTANGFIIYENKFDKDGELIESVEVFNSLEN